MWNHPLFPFIPIYQVLSCPLTHVYFEVILEHMTVILKFFSTLGLGELHGSVASFQGVI